jgi:hypothetical protein
MGTYNNLEEEKYPVWGGVTNSRILKDLILYTVVDKIALHLYGDSLGKKIEVFHLANDIEKWMKEPSIKKQFWVTETGVGVWKEQVDYYRKMIRLFCNVINPEKLIWYRQAIAQLDFLDSGFALEVTTINYYSPIWMELEKRA